MVTIQDIGLQLTKPVKELAEWNYPFSQALETYCSLFNTTNNQSFGEAGLVLQNSTAVYVHRVDCLWNKTEYFKNVMSNYEEEVTKNSTKKRDKKFNMNIQAFKTINFAAEVEKNIDIKKNHITHEIVKSKSRCFTQLEKNIAQSIPIDIYDVNGEIIGKKYDFRCNQNISMDGILVDEFAPQDFCCNSNNSIQKRCPSVNSIYSRVTEIKCSPNTITNCSFVHNNDENNISDIESERNNDDLSMEISDLGASFETNQNFPLFKSTNTAISADAIFDISNDSHDPTLSNTTTENYMNTSNDTDSLLCMSNNVDDSTVLSNNELNSICLNGNIQENVKNGNCLLDNTSELIKLQEESTPLASKPIMRSDNENLHRSKLCNNRIHNTPLKRGSVECKSRMRLKSTPKLNKRSPTAIMFRKKRRVSKNLLHDFQKKNLGRVLEDSLSSQINRPNMFQENLSTCIKYIRQYNPLQYDDVTNVALDLLGFQLRVNESDANTNDNTTNNLSDDEMSEFHSPSSTSPLQEDFCRTWFRSNSPGFLPENIDKWHELMQPKLYEAEKRSTFCIRDYASQIIDSLKRSKQQKINFDEIIREKNTYEVARYFLASLDLATRQNVDIKTDKDVKDNMKITLQDSRQYISNGQADSNV